ncbi:MAG: DUF1490 domain-containing protein [Defluviitaleaceae bacterium]|nr:DUF1490 domain-containing protein [Defluviitaleaceae bacterium]MCL2263372.1 DUF1490 domain-containing protein [Defluviitaleaceae bacterium]
MLHLLGNEKVLIFAGGMLAALLGAKAVKSGKPYKLAVKGLAAGIDMQKRAMETFQNMKEDAEDILQEENATENG